MSDAVLDYSNLLIFYKTLYNRTFEFVNYLIEHKRYNIREVKERLNDYLDNYSYYMINNELVEKNEKKKDILLKIQEFNNFTKNLSEYPSSQYVKIRRNYIDSKYLLSGLSKTEFENFVNEYYSFLTEVFNCLKEFINISSRNGFFPNIRSKKIEKSIGYTNYDHFFILLEDFKTNVSSITSSITPQNSLKVRRCMYALMIIFRPYFNDFNVAEQLIERVNFDILKDYKVIELMYKTLTYESIDHMGVDLVNDIDTNFLSELKESVSLIKRYVSYEFGEIDMSPRIKKKLAYVPLGV